MSAEGGRSVVNNENAQNAQKDTNAKLGNLPKTLIKLCQVCEGRDVDCFICDRKRRVNVLPQKVSLEFTSLFTSTMVTVMIGKDETQYYLHSDVLKIIPYFRGVLNSDFQESKSVIIKLKEKVDSVAAFERIIEWLYLGNYNLEEMCHAGNMDLKFARRGWSAYEKATIEHIKVYLMASRLCAHQIQELSLQKLRALLILDTHTNLIGDWNTCFGMVELTYVNTPSPVKQEVQGVAREGSHSNAIEELSEDKGIESTQTESVESDDEMSCSSDHEQSQPGRPRRDPVRDLVARYFASVIGIVKNESGFSKLIRKFPEFSEDLLHQVGDGPSLAS